MTAAADRTALLLHGLGSRGGDLEAVARALGDGWRPMTPDLRGHGNSPPGPVTSMASFVQDLLALVRERPPAVVAGFSLGAWIALELWGAAPEAVGAIALVDPPLDREPLLAWARQGVGDERAARRRLLALYRERDPQKARRLMREHPLTADLDDAQLEQNLSALLAADRDTMLETLKTGAGPDDARRPPGTTAPALILRGSDSVVCPPDRARRLAAALGAGVAEYPGGHCGHLVAPREIAAALIELAG